MRMSRARQSQSPRRVGVGAVFGGRISAAVPDRVGHLQVPETSRKTSLCKNKHAGEGPCELEGSD